MMILSSNKGYKTLDQDFKCGDFQYEVGKSYYKKAGDASGFIFCKSFRHIFDIHLKSNETTRVVEVEISNDTIPTHINRHWRETNALRVVREVPYRELLEVEGLLKIFEDYITEYSIDDIILTQEKLDLLSEEMFQLSQKDRFILAMRAGVATGREETLISIGKKLGITRERVRQLEQRAICTLLDNFNLDLTQVGTTSNLKKIHAKCKK